MTPCRPSPARPGPAASRLRALLAAGAAAALALATGGCVTQPPPPTNPRNLPSLRAIRSNAPGRETRIPARVEAQLRLGAMIYAIQVPLNQSTDRAWELVDETAVAKPTAALWHANGMRLGLIAEPRLARLLARLPNTHGIAHTSVLGGANAVPVRTSPPLAVALPVYLKAPMPDDADAAQKNHAPSASGARPETSAPPNPAPQAKLHSDRVRLMLAMRSSDAGGVSARLYPARPEDAGRFLPKRFLEKIRKPPAPAGKLAPLRATLSPGFRHAIVIGLYRPWPKAKKKSDNAPPGAPPGDHPGRPPRSPAPASPHRGAKAQGDRDSASDSGPPSPGKAAQAASPPDKLGDVPAKPPGPPPLKTDLGRALFTGYFGQQPTQLVFIISFDRARSRRR